MDFFENFVDFSNECTLKEEFLCEIPSNNTFPKRKGNIDSYGILGPCVEDECMFWKMHKMIEQHTQ